MKIFHTDHFVLPLPEGHRFPMQKYSLLRQRVMQAGLSGVMAGGYARNIADTVDIHFSTAEVATHFQRAAQQSHAPSWTVTR